MSNLMDFGTRLFDKLEPNMSVWEFIEKVKDTLEDTNLTLTRRKK